MVFNLISTKHTLRQLLVSTICMWILCAQSKPVWSQEAKPKAVVMRMFSASTPVLSEQILLQKLRGELALNYDLSEQKAFEQSLRKLTDATGDLNCRQLKCMLEVHQSFPDTSLFMLTVRPNDDRLSLAMIGENRKWRVKHVVCTRCGYTHEEMITNLALSMGGYATPPMSIASSQYEEIKKPVSSSKLSNYVFRPKPHQKTKTIFLDKAEREVRKVINPLEEFKLKLAEKQYNQLIGSKIKKDLMFFRHNNRSQSRKNLKARLRLQIDQSGRVIDRRLLKTSGSNIFDKIVLDTVDLLKLPPPMELLIREPPYVVTILIQP